MSTLNYSFLAGEKKNFPKGKFFKINTASSQVKCIFFNADGVEIGRADFKQGDSINDEIGFSYVEVTSVLAQSVEVHVLPFIMSSSNLVGDVNALTIFKNLTKIGNQYFVGLKLLGQSANYAEVGIHNVAGNTTSVYINVLRLNAGGIDVDFYKT
ncbi:MAG: hypothetical protein QM500_02890, partial [Methylococcales bacterium]